MLGMNLTLKYGLFAVIAILVNLCSQEICQQFYSGDYAIYVAMLAGTVAGLMCKYQLDKSFIFGYRAIGLGDDITKFMTYTLTGLGTTLLFWSFELGFNFVFATRFAQYAGAALGLCLGYFIKFHLDRRYVFSTKAL